MKHLITLVFVVLSISLWAQSAPPSIDQTVNNLKSASTMQNKMIADLQNSIINLNWKVDTVFNIVDINTANIEIISDTLHLKVLDVHSTAHEKIDAIDAIVSQNKTYWMIGSVVLLLLLIILYVLLSNQLKTAAKEAAYQLQTAEVALKSNASKLEEQLLSANKDLVLSNQKLEITTKELHTAQKELIAVHKALDLNHHQLESHQEGLKTLTDGLASALQQLEALKPPKS